MACKFQIIFQFSPFRLAPNFTSVLRHGHHMRGKPPGIAKTLEQRFQEFNQTDPTLDFKVDIGLPPRAMSRSSQLQERLKTEKAIRKDSKLEQLARNRQLLINLDEVNKDWLETTGFYQIKEIADHYGIYQDLFGDAYFYPVVPISVLFDSKDGLQRPVYFGNVIKPVEASGKPQVHFKSDPNQLWTLILTNPDGHFTQQNKEYIHWFVANIPGNQIEKGETIVEYLQPFPPKGTGYHRFVFILYKQEKKLDFSNLRLSGAALELSKRTFSTLDFYRPRQDDLTPASLAFFQTDWDQSLTDFYHNTLQMKEPIFEYDFPPPFIRKQEWFPRRKPFNLYLDKYRDPKQINKEFLMRKLKHIHPFKAPEPALLFPNAIGLDQSIPSWLKLEIRKSRLKWGRINDIE